MNVKKIILTVFLLFSVLVLPAQVLNLSVSGKVDFNNSLYRISDAGNDFPASITDESSVSISLPYRSVWDRFWNNPVKYQVTVNKSDFSWPANLKLEIARDGNGRSDSFWGTRPIVYNGSAFQTIGNTSAYFFGGQYAVVDIPLKIRLSGASITMGARQFDTNIMFTLYEE